MNVLILRYDMLIQLRYLTKITQEDVTTQGIDNNLQIKNGMTEYLSPLLGVVVLAFNSFRNQHSHEVALPLLPQHVGGSGHEGESEEEYGAPLVVGQQHLSYSSINSHSLWLLIVDTLPRNDMIEKWYLVQLSYAYSSFASYALNRRGMWIILHPVGILTFCPVLLWGRVVTRELYPHYFSINSKT